MRSKQLHCFSFRSLFTGLSVCLFYLFVCCSQILYAAEYPQRIISLGPINTENVFLLGAGDRLVGNTRYCVRPEAAKDKEKVGSLLQAQMEKIIGLQPDLVLATNLTRPEQIKQLRALGIRVVHFTQPSSFEETCQFMLQLGTILGLAEEADRIVKIAKAKVRAVQEAIADLPPEKVFLQLGTNPLHGAAPNTFTSDFIELAGGTNILSGQRKGKTSVEKVIAENPETIIVAIMGSELGIAAQEKEKWMNIPVLKAAQTGRVHVVNPNLVCSPSPVTFAEALQDIALLIHPELSTITTP